MRFGGILCTLRLRPFGLPPMPADLRSKPSFRRYRRALSRVLSRPPPPPRERERAEGRVVLLIASNHAFHPRTPRLRSSPLSPLATLPLSPSLSFAEPGCRQRSTRWNSCGAPWTHPHRGPRAAFLTPRDAVMKFSLSLSLPPSCNSGTLHRRADRPGCPTRSLRHAVRPVTSILDRLVVRHRGTVGDLGEINFQAYVGERKRLLTVNRVKGNGEFIQYFFPCINVYRCVK